MAGHYSSARCRHTPQIQPQHHCHEIRWGSGGPTLHSEAVYTHKCKPRVVIKAITVSRKKEKKKKNQNARKCHCTDAHDGLTCAVCQRHQSRIGCRWIHTAPLGVPRKQGEGGHVGARRSKGGERHSFVVNPRLSASKLGLQQSRAWQATTAVRGAGTPRETNNNTTAMKLAGGAAA